MLVRPRRVEEGVVGRHAADRGDAQELAERGREVLRSVPVAVLADSDEQRAVRSEVQPSAVVVRVVETRQVEKGELAVRCGHVSGGGEAAHSVVRQASPGRCGTRTRSRCRKVRVEGDADQTPLPCRVDRQRHERRSEQRPVLHDPHVAALLRDEHATVGCDGKRGRTRQVRRHDGVEESRPNRRRARRLAATTTRRTRQRHRRRARKAHRQSVARAPNRRPSRARPSASVRASCTSSGARAACGRRSRCRPRDLGVVRVGPRRAGDVEVRPRLPSAHELLEEQRRRRSRRRARVPMFFRSAISSRGRAGRREQRQRPHGSPAPSPAACTWSTQPSWLPMHAGDLLARARPCTRR